MNSPRSINHVESLARLFSSIHVSAKNVYWQHRFHVQRTFIDHFHRNSWLGKKKKKKIIKDNGGKNLYPLYYYFFLFLFNISIRTCSLKFIFQWTYLEINAEHILKTFATNFAVDCYYSQSCLWLVVGSISSPASICQAMEMSQIIYAFSCGTESKGQSNV